LETGKKKIGNIEARGGADEMEGSPAGGENEGESDLGSNQKNY